MNRCSTIVSIGDLPMGGTYPIRLQSMTNTNTSDIEATLKQVKKILKAGADLVRVSTPSLKDVNSLGQIKQQLRNEGFSAPLVADIHFNPLVAEEAARIVEKIRINPGNYTDRKFLDSTPQSFDLEKEKMHEKMLPLLKICKEYGTTIRVGVNAGSLSERIMSRYGNTPEGMVESALEFIRICENESFYSLVLSMKASNVKTMIESSILLQEKMKNCKHIYPQHIGITEAGSGESGRILSALGISTLISQGIGDTIRVSLSEPPENEIPVARKIVKYSHSEKYTKNLFEIESQSTPIIVLPFEKNEKPWVPDTDKDLVFTDNKLLKINEANNLSTNIPYSEINNIEELKSISQDKSLIMIGNFNKLSFESSTIKMLKEKTKFLVIRKKYNNKNKEDFGIALTCDTGKYLLNNQIDGLFIENENIEYENICETILSLFQSTRRRISQNDYISCPTCGRTNFDMLHLLEEIKLATSEFKNLKIAVMGCTVNGPGEMADADYGCVGAGKVKVNLYKGRICIKKGVPLKAAALELVQIIRSTI